MKWIIRALVAILLVLLLLLLLEHCHGGHAPGKCEKGVPNADCQAQLSLGDLQYAPRTDGSLAIAAPILNDGGRPAEAVQVSAVTIAGGALLAPVSLPAPLGGVAPGGQAVLQTRFGGLSVPGAYTITVQGSYTDKGVSHPFSLTGDLAVRAVGGPPTLVSTITVVTQSGHGPLPPSAIHNEDTNSEDHALAVPLGEIQKPFTVAPTGTGPAKAPPPGSGGSSATILQDTPGVRGGGFPPDPSTAEANGAGVVLSTGNTYLLVSTDDGAHFTQYDPTTILPSADGGLCCDQVVVYDEHDDLFFWLLQYKSDSSGNNRLRVAYAHAADIKASVYNWTWIDLTNTGFNSKNALDYPDLALTGSYIYVSVDGVDKNGKNSGLIVARMPLSQMQLGSGHNVSIGYFGPNESTDVTRARGGRLTQNSPSGMFWAGHVDTAHTEIFSWPDGSSSVTSNSAAVNTWCQSDYTSAAPDGGQWIDNTRAQGTGSVIAGAYKATGGGHGEIWFGWDAGRDVSGCTQNRPQPYVKIVRISDQSLKSVGEYHIWNTPYAFAYPSLASAPNGDIGVAVSYGGPSNYAASTVGYLGDYVVYYVDPSATSLVFYAATGGVVFTRPTPTSPPLTRYGDMFAVRRSGAGDADFSTEGYSWQYVDTTKSTSCATAPGCTYRLHYEQFGRPAPAPIK